MNIPICPSGKTNYSVHAFCPDCHSPLCRRHGSYVRRGFHAPNHAVAIAVTVPRYRCLNPECLRCTFSILPPLVLRYCRFFWPYLLTVLQSHAAGTTPYHQARHVWSVGRGVILRTVAMFARMTIWVAQLHQELSDGRPQRSVELMVKIILRKLGRIVLIERWYRHHYPLRFCAKTSITQFECTLSR